MRVPDPIVVNDLLMRMPELGGKKERTLELNCGGLLGQRYDTITRDNHTEIIGLEDNATKADYMKRRAVGMYDVIIACLPPEPSSKNNPYGFNELLLKALKDVKKGGYVCSLQKITHLESQKRHEMIYGMYKPERVYIYSHRIDWVDLDKNVNVKGTSTYTWCIWHKGEDGKFSRDSMIDWVV